MLLSSAQVGERGGACIIATAGAAAALRVRRAGGGRGAGTLRRLVLPRTKGDYTRLPPIPLAVLPFHTADAVCTRARKRASISRWTKSSSCCWRNGHRSDRSRERFRGSGRWVTWGWSWRSSRRARRRGRCCGPMVADQMQSAKQTSLGFGTKCRFKDTIATTPHATRRRPPSARPQECPPPHRRRQKHRLVQPGPGPAATCPSPAGFHTL